MTSPVDFISGPKRISTLGKRLKGKTASLTEICRGQMVSVRPTSLQGLSQHDPRRQFGQGNADGLADKGHGAGGPGIDFQDVKNAVLDGILDIHETHHADFPGDPFRLFVNGL